jgi:TonB family protein
MAILRRPLLISGALHALVAALIAFTATPRPIDHEPAGARDSGAAPAEVALVPQPPPPSMLVIDVAMAGGTSGWAGDRRARAADATPARRVRSARPAPIALAVAPEIVAPEITDAVALPEDTTEAAPIAAIAASAEATEPAAAATGATAGAPDGTGNGEAAAGLGGAGAGDGNGDGSGAGFGGKDARGALHARVLGNVAVDVHPREGVPVIAHDEATALRERDAFPRLHERVWTRWQPYLVSLEVCVASTGRVDEVVLRSSASAELDPIVVAAVKTWRYRPRMVGGQPAPFCHGVVIKYERW